MIAFGSAIVDPEAYRRFAEPGIRRVAEPDSVVLPFHAVGTLSRGYNVVLDAAARLEGLEALVLVDPRVELTDPGFCGAVRTALADPEVGVAGVAGASGVRTIAWWDGEVSCGPLRHRYHEHGGGELDAYGWTRPRPAGADVDMVAGFLLALSPWALESIRFDERLPGGQGYDVDFGRRVRAAGKRVRTAPFAAVHHRALDIVPVRDEAIFVEGHIHAALADAPPEDDPGWKARARRAEAEREAARTLAYSNELRSDAEVLGLQRELDAMTASRWWRTTAPLRAVNRLRRRGE
jgi:hypothetical protein